LSSVTDRIHRPPHSRRRERGISLLEAQVALLLLFLTLAGILAVVASQSRHISNLEQYSRARGVVNTTRKRAFVSLSAEGDGAGSACAVSLSSLDVNAGVPSARVAVSDP
jgi:Tfp pilus assembly protein PilV